MSFILSRRILHRISALFSFGAFPFCPFPFRLGYAQVIRYMLCRGLSSALCILLSPVVRPRRRPPTPPAPPQTRREASAAASPALLHFG